MDTLIQDIRYSLRQLVQHRQLTIAALLVLGLGIGANATIFGLVEAVVWRPLPGVSHPEQLVELHPDDRVVSYPAYRDLRDDGKGMIDLAGASDRTMSISGEGRAALVHTQVVSGNYFSVLGVTASAGRLIAPSDDQTGSAAVAVLSWRYWRSDFGGDASIIGRTVDINDRAVRIIGVASPDFRGLWVSSTPDLWVPVAAWPALAPSNYARLSLDARGWDWFTAFGRLAPGVSVAQASSTINASFDRLKRTYPRQMGELGTITLAPSVQAALPVARSAVVRFMAVLMTVVALVLLLVCANVANLLLARGAARRREFGVRLALGASRVRLMRQLFTESAVLSLAAAMVALFLMNAAAGLLARVTVDGKSLGSLALGPDLRMVAFIALLALGSAVVFGLMPARQSLAIDLTPALRDGAAGSGHKRSRLRSVLLASQVALSLVLLIGAGLFTRALQRALSMDPGFSPDHVAVTGVNPGLAHYDAARASTYYAQVSERLAGLKGFTDFAWATSLPLSGDHDQESIDIPGYVAPNAKRLSVEVQFVSGGYFPVLRIPMRAGRSFETRDAPGAMHVAVVNETMARKFWPDRDAIGQRFMMLNDTMTIVGVARDVKYHELSEAPRPFVYLNAIQQLDKGSPGAILLIARTTGDPAAAAASLKAALLSADPHVVPFGMTTADAQLRDLLLPQRAGAMVLGGFSLLALIIALIGVHGVVSYAVSRRTREIGIRVALGARGDRVVRELVREHVPAIAGGLAVGLALAAAGTRAMASFLYGVSATDFTTFAGASLLMAAVALAAAAIPARRAAKVDPMTALRYE